METSNKRYREKLVQQIKDAGEELIKRSDTLVHPDLELITDFDITLSFSQDCFPEITMEDIVEKVKKDGYITLNDPCCGAGATLIAGIHAARKRLEKANLNYQNHILVAAQDIDMVVALMCYIQLSLLGVAAYIKVGNSLTEPMTENDSLDNYWFTMMYFSDIWSMRRLLRSL